MSVADSITSSKQFEGDTDLRVSLGPVRGVREKRDDDDDDDDDDYDDDDDDDNDDDADNDDGGDGGGDLMMVVIDLMILIIILITISMNITMITIIMMTCAYIFSTKILL